MTATSRLAMAPGQGGGLWAWPARSVARVHPDLAAALPRDLATVESLPLPAPHLILTVLAVAVPALFVLFRVTMTTVYTESLLYLLLVVALAFAVPTSGPLIVLVHVIADLLATLGSVMEWGSVSPIDYVLVVAGRLVASYLLWLLLVEFPLAAHAFPEAASRRPMTVPALERYREPIVAGSIGVAAGALVFVWTQAAPWLIRPVFTWNSVWVYPTFEAINPVQAWGVVLIAGGGLAAAASAWWRSTRATELAEAAAASIGELRLPVGPVGRFAPYLLAVIVVAGLITGIVDLLLFAAAAVVAPLAAAAVLRVPGIRTILLQIPWIVRFVAGFALTFLVGVQVTNIIYYPLAGSEFFPLVITTAIGFVMFGILLGADAPEIPTTPRAPRGVIGPVIVGLAVGWSIHLAAPAVVSADNCSGLSDCGPQMAGAAGAAGAAAAGAAAASRRRRGPAPRPDPTDRLAERLREMKRRYERDQFNPPPGWDKRSWRDHSLRWDVQRYYERHGRYPPPPKPVNFPGPKGPPIPDSQTSGNYNLGVGG